MRFEIKTKNKSDYENAKKLLFEFRESTMEEYEKEKKKIDSRLKLIPTPTTMKAPDYVCAVTEEDGKLIFWNSFITPTKMGVFNIFNPFKKAIKTMENNIMDFLKDNGIETEVRFIGN